MNEIQLLCLDIDGTLLNSHHQISDKNRRAIEKVVKEKKIPVVLVSARMPRGIVFLAEKLQLNSPMICYSGALVVDQNRIISAQYLDFCHVEKIYSIVKEYDVHMSVYKKDEWYVEHYDEWAAQEEKITGIIPNTCSYEALFRERENRQEGCNKLLCMGAPERIEALQIHLKKLFANQFNMYLSKSTYLEIMPRNASKTAAITVLLKKYNLDKSALMAIGDNFNDMDMIRYAGLGVAMGNSPDEVKKCADVVTTSNDEDGVAYAIHTYIV